MKRLISRNGVTLLGWLVYTISYLGKVNYSANITQVIDYYGVTKAEAGIVPTFFFFAYGIGQVLNGILSKRYNVKWSVFISLFASAIINLLVAVNTDFSAIKWLWMTNGFLLSMLWPSLVRLLSESLPQKELGKSSVIMGTTVASGTLIIYALSSLYAEFFTFKLAFYTAAFAGMLVSVVWLFLYEKTVSESKKRRAEEETVRIAARETELGAASKERHAVIITAAILCMCAVGVNLIKDGLTTWVPSILKEEGSMPASLSILLTLFLPIVAIFGNAFALTTHKRIPDYALHCMVIFVAIAVVMGAVLKGLAIKNVLIMLVGMMTASFFAASLNSLITSIFPMFMREHINSGMCAGVLNGFCYVGSTISSYGLGFVADKFGWNAVFFSLLGACVLLAGICCVHLAFQKALKKS